MTPSACLLGNSSLSNFLIKHFLTVTTVSSHRMFLTRTPPDSEMMTEEEVSPPHSLSYKRFPLHVLVCMPSRTFVESRYTKGCRSASATQWMVAQERGDWSCKDLQEAMVSAEGQQQLSPVLLQERAQPRRRIWVYRSAQRAADIPWRGEGRRRVRSVHSQTTISVAGTYKRRSKCSAPLKSRYKNVAWGWVSHKTTPRSHPYTTLYTSSLNRLTRFVIDTHLLLLIASLFRNCFFNVLMVYPSTDDILGDGFEQMACISG